MLPVSGSCSAWSPALDCAFLSFKTSSSLTSKTAAKPVWLQSGYEEHPPQDVHHIGPAQFRGKELKVHQWG
eukprot:1148706-Pelagomonas_calceolata.AAC.6